jgi:microcin C transport system substrate-binding protein
VLGGGAAVAIVLKPAMAGEVGFVHGMSAFGDLKYPKDFKQFDYVNADAPKGGLFSTIPSSRSYNQSFQTFNSLNAFILKGDGAIGIEQTFTTLMTRSGDEPDAMYGLAASGVQVSADGLTYRFKMRPEVRFHDGARLTAKDAAFSLSILKEKGHPIIRQQMRDVIKAEAPDDDTLVVTFAPNRARDVPLYVASLPIFSKAYYAKQPFEESTLEVSLGSGPYKVGKFEVGRFIEYDRVKDWWGASLPVAKGAFNFDTVRYEFYRDRDVAFEGFTARNYLYREEFTARVWATRYDFPAVKDGRVKRETLPDETPSGAQGWFLNTRRDQFKDPRVREALGCAFDFEWTNKTIMYGAYARTVSPFQNSDLMAKGPPDADELKLLEPFRGKVPDEVFGEPFVPPVSDGSGQDRKLLRKAAHLLQEAGWTIKDGKRVSKSGQRFTLEFLLDEPSFQPHHASYIKNLGVLGIDASLRLVDPVQYRARRDDFDFDVTIERFSMASTPGEALRTFFYWVPQWYRNNHPIAYWDVFGHPAKLPRYAGVGVPDLWWHDAAKASKPEQAK